MIKLPQRFLILIAFLALAGAGCAGSSGLAVPSSPPLDERMREHCKMMPAMRGCEAYLQEAQPQPSSSIDRSTVSLAPVQEQKIVDLKNGQTYPMTASFVQKTVAGNTIRMLAYNGEIPGPILRVKQGDSIKVNFTNKLDQPTTVHWHGLRLDNANDGVPDVTQPPIKAGETFTYDVKFPDAGLYWYHPHMREDYQQELGMYGLIWVEPSDAKTFAAVNQTAFVTLDDILFSGNDVSTFDSERINHTLMGRFGNVMLVNGDTNYSLTAKAGDVVRFAMVNTANTRVFKVAIPGVKMKLVGGDSGGYSHDTWVDSVTLAPSERAIVNVQFSKSGTYQLRHVGPDVQYDLGTITVSNAVTDHDYSTSFNILQDRSAQFASLQSYYGKPIDKELDLTIDMPGMMGNMQMNDMMGQAVSKDGIEWEDSMAAMNTNSTDKSLDWSLKDKATGLEDEKIDYVFKLGSKVKIRLYNDENSMHPMQHPIHFHGNRFIVLAVNGVKNTNPVWKDTVLVPIGAKVDILLDASNPGTWMAHCHISEHLEDGMMLEYIVR